MAFKIEKGVAGLETAFIATYENAGGNGPAISFLAEYDALAEVGHACGHNIIGTSCVGAAVALAKNLGSIPAKVIVFGCPAEKQQAESCPWQRQGFLSVQISACRCILARDKLQLDRKEPCP